MLGQASLPELKTSLPLQDEADQDALTDNNASQRRTRFLWRGLGFAVLMLIGFSAIALHPTSLHDPGQFSSPVSQIAYKFMPPVLHPGGILPPIRHVGSPYAPNVPPHALPFGQEFGQETSSPVSLPVDQQLQMLIEDAPRDGGISMSVAKDGLVPATFPPTKVEGVNAMQLASNWADKMAHLEEEGASLSQELDDKASRLSRRRNEKTEALSIMRARLLEEVETLEAVALTTEDLEMSSFESGSLAADSSVLAMGVFSREQLTDDSQGTIRNRIESQYGKEDTRRWLGRARTVLRSRKPLEVFALEGLAEGPDLPELSARTLLFKLFKYAQWENRLMVVPERAYTSIDGRELTEYYVRLGFEKIDITDGPFLKQRLVYLGSSFSATDMFVQNHQVMIGMNL